MTKRLKITSRSLNLRHSEINSHDKAVTYLMYKYKLPRYNVRSILIAFFGRYGLKYFISRYQNVMVNGLGYFYFHKSTQKQYERYQQQVFEYNRNIKQKLHEARKKGIMTEELKKMEMEYKKRKK